MDQIDSYLRDIEECEGPNAREPISQELLIIVQANRYNIVDLHRLLNKGGNPVLVNPSRTRFLKNFHTLLVTDHY